MKIGRSPSIDSKGRKTARQEKLQTDSVQRAFLKELDRQVDEIEARLAAEKKETD